MTTTTDRPTRAPLAAWRILTDWHRDEVTDTDEAVSYAADLLARLHEAGIRLVTVTDAGRMTPSPAYAPSDVDDVFDLLAKEA